MDPLITVVEAKVEELEREVGRLGSRLTFLEKSFAEALPRADVRAQGVSQRTSHGRSPLDVSSTTRPQPAPISSVAPARNAEPALPPPRPALIAEPPSSLTGWTPATEPSAVTQPKRHVSLEERLGQNWLNKLGIVTLITGLALLLGYQARTLGPLGKSILGLLLSVAILVTGLVLERLERYRVFARAGIGGGWALLYFVAFALFHMPAMQVLHSQAADLVLMLSVAVGMVLHSLRYRSQGVTSLAFLLAFFTLTISHLTLFSLVAGAILAVGLVAVAFRERWFVLVLSGLTAVYLNHFLWLHRILPNGAQPGHPFAEFLPSAALLLVYWLLFRVFYIFRVPDNESDRVSSTLNVLLNSAGLLTLLKYQSAHPEWAFGGLLALGAAELGLAFVARHRHHNAFVALSSIASVLLLAAVPFHFAGSSWSLMWLLQSELLFIAGLALRETIFRRLGVLSAFAAIAHLLGSGATPVFELRQLRPDVSHHAVLSLAFVCAALCSWFNAEYAVRRWPRLAEEAFDQGALRGLSYAAVLCTGVAAWLALAGPWTLLPWLALALLLAFAADHLRSADLAQQAELLAIVAIVRAAAINFAQWDNFTHAPRTLILLTSCALLYAQMRRRQPSHWLQRSAIETFYTWAAAALLSTVAWYALEPAAVAVAWCLLGTVLLETGFASRRTFFRQQGLVLLGASFVRLFFINIALAFAPRLYTMLPLAVIYAYAYQRVYASKQPSRLERIAGAATAWLSLITVATLLYFSLRPEWVSIGGAMLAVAILLLARMLRRPLFRAQAIALILITAARTLGFNLLSAESLSAHFTESRFFTVGITCALLFGALPIAFALRKQKLAADSDQPACLYTALRQPEQVLFFAPLLLLFAWIPIELRAGMITVGWSALGLLTFLFALGVGERSFRLVGLGLLLVGVGKIVTIDIWHASPTDRYITLIVMGAALLLVSFLYSRFREKILELL